MSWFPSWRVGACPRDSTWLQGEPQSRELQKDGPSQVQISREFGKGGFFRFLDGFDGSWTCFQRGFDRFLEGSLTMVLRLWS